VGIIALSTVLNQLVVSRTNGTNLCPLIASLPTVPHCSTSIHTAMQALGITLDPEPLALPSTRNRLRTAMRRGAAWSAGRPSSFLAVRRGRLALAGGPAAEPSWLQSPRRCPQEHGWASQRAAAGRSSPGGADAGRALVTGSTSSARVRCPVSGASVQCPRVHAWPVHATAVQCPMRTSERPGVRRPVSSVDVRCPSVPASAVSDREVVEGGGGAGSREASGWTWPSSWRSLSIG